MLVVENSIIDNEEKEVNSAKVLIIDSIDTDKYKLKNILQESTCQIILASHEDKIRDIVISEQPDIIFFNFDQNNPKYLSQLQYIRFCKKYDYVNEYQPYVVVVISEQEHLPFHIEDYNELYDFVYNKPYHSACITSILNTWGKIKSTEKIIDNQENKINKYSNQINQEMELASNIINRLVRDNSLKPGNIKYSQFPMEMLSGDIFLTTFNPQGHQIILVGDLTGHGLAAAVGAMVVYDIFYTMVQKGFSLNDIAKEVNKKLRRIQNTGRFMCACLIELDLDNNYMHILNAGLPDVLLKGKNTGIKSKIKSSNLPLGILDSDKLELKIERLELSKEDKIYIYTDGLNERQNQQGEQIGNQRIYDLFANNPEKESLYDDILNLVYSFGGNAKRTDDITLVEITCEKSLVKSCHKLKSEQLVKTPMPWCISYDFDSAVLRKENPLPLILQTVTELQGLRIYREHIYTVLTEMFSNALEHGLLDLDSKLKKDPDGFARYYGLREERLEKLHDAKIKITLQHHPISDISGKLTLTLSHNGTGFNYGKMLEKIKETNNNFHGRGIKLISNICSDVKYSDEGRCLEVDYIWDTDFCKLC